MTSPWDNPMRSRQDLHALVQYVAENHDRLRGDGMNSLAIALGSMRGADKLLHVDDLSQADTDLLWKLVRDVANQNPGVWGVSD